MMLPLFHHGMILLGLPYSEADLRHTTTGGTPYGASHLSSTQGEKPISDEEKRLSIALGKRLAELAAKLK